MTLRAPTLTEALQMAEHFDASADTIATNGDTGMVDFLVTGDESAPDVLRLGFLTMGFTPESLQIHPDKIEGSDLPAFRVVVNTKGE